MTELGEFLQRKSVNKAEVARRTGISKARITELSNNSSARLTAKELYLILLAVDEKPGEIFEKLYKNITLKQIKGSITLNKFGTLIKDRL